MTSLARIGFLGAGAVAHDHAACAVAIGARVVAAVASCEGSKSFKAFASMYPEVRYVADAKTLANAEDIDAIVVCLPWNIQEKWLDWALTCNKPVLIEKPVALSEEYLSKRLAQGHLLSHTKLVGYNRRFYETVRRLRERLALGGLRAVDITISEDLAGLVRRRGFDCLDYALENSSCHIIDTAISLFGDLRVVHMARFQVPYAGNFFNCYNGMLETPEKVPVGFFANSDDPAKVGIRCKFADGTFWCLTPTEILSVFQGYDIVERTAECQVRQYEPKLIQKFVENSDKRPGFQAQMAAFLSGRIGPGCSLLEALKTLRLISSIKTQSRGNLI
ncbi:MAG: Gfo/Idh/MocA family oxidoreductase [Thalassospira sp.]|uniref:Gfo/Idh/MocA family protein n=1 Tax=Thalassospira sp. TaxID=1912094 RepID=UPI0032EDF318